MEHSLSKTAKALICFLIGLLLISCGDNTIEIKADTNSGTVSIPSLSWILTISIINLMLYPIIMIVIYNYRDYLTNARTFVSIFPQKTNEIIQMLSKYDQHIQETVVRRLADVITYQNRISFLEERIKDLEKKHQEDLTSVKANANTELLNMQSKHKTLENEITALKFQRESQWALLAQYGITDTLRKSYDISIQKRVWKDMLATLGDIELVLNEILSSKYKNKELEAEISGIKGRNNRLNSNIRTGQLSPESATLERNQIYHSVISMIDTIQS